MLHGGPLPGKGLPVAEDICESVALFLCTAAVHEIFIQLPMDKVKDPCPAFVPISQKKPLYTGRGKIWAGKATRLPHLSSQKLLLKKK